MDLESGKHGKQQLGPRSTAIISRTQRDFHLFQSLTDVRWTNATQGWPSEGASVSFHCAALDKPSCSSFYDKGNLGGRRFRLKQKIFPLSQITKAKIFRGVKESATWKGADKPFPCWIGRGQQLSLAVGGAVLIPALSGWLLMQPLSQSISR